ncbi:MAG: ATP-binding protein [Methanomassiliicoccaceae archaeon]|nr:ATP-binding protein [Methanomassiliicoccaceae archaeon]
MNSPISRKIDVYPDYRPRTVDILIRDCLDLFGGVHIVGCKWCGKSWTGMHHSNSCIFLDSPEERSFARANPRGSLEGEEPRLVDEWQDIPELWDMARHNIDRINRSGMYIFTGSSVPPIDLTSHSGAGRFATVKMRPMSLFESGDSSGTVSLAELFEGGEIKNFDSEMDYERMLELIIRGGWPAGLNKNKKMAAMIPKQYIETISESDISRVDGVKRNPGRVRRVLRSLARNNATMAGMKVLRSDTAEEGNELSNLTVNDYLDALRKIYVIDEQEAWDPSSRSKTRMITSPKRHFVDPSLAVAALNVGYENLYKDVETLGFLFESMCYRDMSVYASVLSGKVFHYRDKHNLEADQIIEDGEGRWGAAEVRIGVLDIDSAAENLLRMSDRFDEENGPSFLMVLNATSKAAYTRRDGVHVVPLGTLGP